MSAKSPPTKTKPPAPAKPRTPPPTWDEQLINRLTPWRAELLGGALLLLVFFILLGLSGLPTLTGVDWLAGLLNQLAGWGTYILCFLLGLVGLQLILRRTRRRFRLRPSQVIGLELMTLAALALSYLLGRPTLAGAYQGRGGGIIGWALSSPLIEYLGPFLTALLYGGLLLWGFAILLGVRWLDVLRWLTQAADRLQQWAGHIQQPAGTTIPTSGSGPAQPAAVPPPRIRQPAAQPEATASPRPERRNPLLPPLTLLEEEKEALLSQTEIEQKKRIIEQTLKDFDLAATVTEIRRGPAVTQFGVQPGYVERPGPDGQPRQYKVRVGQIAALHRDLALALAAPRLRIEAPVPGRGIVGVEVPNGETSVVRLRSILNADAFRHIRGTLAVGMGRDVAGAPVATDLAKLPHLLIAGTTGSGKSVCINALVACLVCNNTPEQLRLVMMDPKKVELIRFNGLPHLLGRVEVEHERIIGVLRWLTAEMDRRYQAFAALGARHLQDYNRKIAGARQPATTPAPTPAPPPVASPLPYVAVFIDELADLMAAWPVDTERTLCRLAQMARATGIHLVVATQRPSTDVITGLIKANFPARIAFAVASGTDSRVILDTVGAEHLLGKGDMLFLSPEASNPVRLQGCFVSDTEIERIVGHWQTARPASETAAPPWEELIERQSGGPAADELLNEAVALAEKHDNLSASFLQRRLRLGYPRAARLMETLYEMGLVDDPKAGHTRRSAEDEDGL